jgi:hypothetical protein
MQKALRSIGGKREIPQLSTAALLTLHNGQEQLPRTTGVRSRIRRTRRQDALHVRHPGRGSTRRRAGS